jgi:hypothetical protein
MLTSTGKTYRIAFRKFLAEKLSEPQKLQVKLDVRAIHKHKVFKDISSVLTESRNSHNSSELGNIDSAILTMSLIREIANILTQSEIGDSLSESNFFSLVFDKEAEEGKVQPLDFNEVKSNIDKLFEETIVWDDNTALINISVFKEMTYRVSNLRFANKTPDKNKNKMKLPLIKEIQFNNYKDGWKLLDKEKLKKEIAEK